MTAPNNATDGGVVATSDSNAEQDADLDLILGDWVSQVTGLPRNLVRRRWQLSAPVQPDRDADWCALSVVRVSPDQNAAANWDGDENYTVRMHETLEVFISFYGPDATKNAMRLRIGVTLDINRGLLRDHGMVFRSASEPIRVPAIVNLLTLLRTDLTIWLRRQEIVVYPVQSVLSSAGTIATEEVTATFDTENS